MLTMRIDGLGRVVAGSGPTRPGAASGAFSLSEGAEAAAPKSAAPLRAAPGLDALIALQAVPPETARERRKREIRRGRGLLDALDEMKLALIEGRDDPASLKRLVDSLAERRAATDDAGLDDALSAIELRAQVELAKRGR
ncbi:flagellar assembly protein FliX [Chenggangzhangella methanolivorans]|uniref:Flagellar assembly protein FliX n=2 Tax=Chenggangzhangella methanolivorans TaxID=1437009 RepID=A0A9E6UIL8_9HYPH|nr:flagellar assembly protein FliX [Chenggangzhangella methanolivorans]QZO01008.1 flagellar assembly protein FliX [Chenggangzhangella methanolivorans]